MIILSLLYPYTTSLEAAPEIEQSAEDNEGSQPADQRGEQPAKKKRRGRAAAEDAASAGVTAGSGTVTSTQSKRQKTAENTRAAKLLSPLAPTAVTSTSTTAAAASTEATVVEEKPLYASPASTAQSPERKKRGSKAASKPKLTSPSLVKQQVPQSTPSTAVCVIGHLFDVPGGASKFVCGEGVVHTRSVDFSSPIFFREHPSCAARKQILRADLNEVSTNLAELKRMIEARMYGASQSQAQSQSPREDEQQQHQSMEQEEQDDEEGSSGDDDDGGRSQGSGSSGAGDESGSDEGSDGGEMDQNM